MKYFLYSLRLYLRDSLLLYENNDFVEIFKNLDRYTSENNVGLLK